jgi:hypothetical protein
VIFVLDSEIDDFLRAFQYDDLSYSYIHSAVLTVDVQ